MESQPPVPTPGLPKEDEAGLKPVEKIETPDYVAELKAKDDKIAQLQQEKDNYRKMGLKYKKEAAEDPVDEPILTEDRFRQIAREEFMNSQLATANAEKEEYIKTMAKQLSEAKTALANKAQISNMPGGSSQPSDTVTVEKLASDQKAELEAKAREIGVDPVKFVAEAVKNLAKIK